MAQPEGTLCTYCGMTCAPGEYHPYGVCLMFKACRNSETVRANLAAMREHFQAEARQQDEALIRQMRNALFALPLPYSSETRAALQAGNDWLDAEIKARARLGTTPPPGPDVPKPEA